MALGVCKFWRGDFGYGFFEVEDGRDLFVHVSQVKRAGFSALTQGQRARFELGSNARIGQPMAIDLQLLEPIISPKVTPTPFRPERSSREIAEAAFTKR
jgi:cold shock protein